MPNTELFAPIVDALQPAFIYNENRREVDIYFSYSTNNNYQTGDKMDIIVKDPNKTSIWGDNKIHEVADATITATDESGLYKVSVAFPAGKLTVNQYYQAQLTLKRDSQKSPVSQITLIRPIPATAAVVIEQLVNEFTENPSLDTITGYVEYVDGSRYEYIKDYTFEIKEVQADGKGKIIHVTPVTRNTLGTNFSFSLPKLTLEKNKRYMATFSYITINKYKNSVTKYFQYNIPELTDSVDGPIFTARNNYSKGCIELTFDFSNQGYDEHLGLINPSFTLEKAAQDDNYFNWETIGSGSVVAVNGSSKIVWEDYLFNNNINYRYRLTINDNSFKGYFDNKTQQTVLYTASMKVDDIYLSDSNMLVPIKYNAKVTGLKWVVQENITNTLGGVYPVIRRNADTYYRQFSLSGTLDFNVPKIEAFSDSVKDLHDYDHVFETFSPLSLSLGEGSQFQKEVKDYEVPSQVAKKYIMKFLTDGQIKLFKSGPEGAMLVHLSNVSFSPNATLGREIVDFSCTVTEVGPVTKETLKRYSVLNYGNFITYLYTLNIEGFRMNDNQVSIPYITLDKLYDNTIVIERTRVESTVR